jgi:hypothetical protein
VRGRVRLRGVSLRGCVRGCVRVRCVAVCVAVCVFAWLREFS